MKVSIAHLRAAGLTDTQIVKVLEEADAERREKARIIKRKQRARPPDGVDTEDTVSPLPSTATTSTVVQEERTEIGALGREWTDFYSRYPHKVAPRKARVAFERARKRASFDVIMAGLERYANKTDDRPWANPATWLNGDRWDDQPGPAQEGNGYGRGRPAPKDDPKSIRGAFDRLFERLDRGDEAGELSRQAHLRLVPGRSSE